MAQSVRGKAAVVTGAGSGLNLALATGLLARGCHVLFADLCLRPEAEEIVQLHAQAASEARGRAVFQKTDVTSWRQLENMFDTAQSEFGGIDIVVAGAGVFEPVGFILCFLLQVKGDLFSNEIFSRPPGLQQLLDSPRVS